jgi:hypothetical protein
LGQYLLIEVEGGVIVAVAIEFVVGELVGGLKLVVVGQVLLDCVVGQVDALANLLRGELLRSGSDVPLLVPEELEPSAHLHS